MNSIVTAAPNAERRIDLDWVRIIAFALLILYHTTGFFDSGTPHNQALSPRTVPWLIVPMLALNPWRLLILFIVSGAATRFMADKMRPAALAGMRSGRLLPPLLFVMAVIVPPIAFVGVRQWSAYPGDFVSFLGHYFTADQSVCHHSACPPIPNYFHLWFVAYLWVYTVVLVGLLAYAPAALRALQRMLEQALQGWGLILYPAAYLALTRFALERLFPQSYDVIHDWYAHAVFFGGFLLGFSLAKSDAIWAAFERMRVPTLIGALLIYAQIIVFLIVTLGTDFNWAHKAPPGTAGGPSLGSVLTAIGYGFDQWLWIAAAFGFARRYLSQRDGAVRRYLTDAIFPFYIIHELTIVVGGYYLTRFGLNLGLEFAILVTATVVSCFATYEFVRRVPGLRPFFGLKMIPAPAKASRASPAAFYLREEG